MYMKHNVMYLPLDHYHDYSNC